MNQAVRTARAEREHAEEQLRELSGRLINAQEDERRRIARELHDDLNQRLALLSIELEEYGQCHPRSVEEHRRRMRDVDAPMRSPPTSTACRTSFTRPSSTHLVW